MTSKLRRFVPALTWLATYDRATFRSDLAAGLTVAVMLIPQAMAYAALAGLPPIIGLYASIVPLALYALLGTSRELAVGPVAMVSLLVATGIGALAETGTSEFIGLAILLALMVGVLQLVMGLARLGFLVNFLSHPVISGFTSAAALIIGFSQLKHLLGVDLPRSHHVHATLIEAASRIDETHVITLIIGVASIAIMMALKRFKPLFPRALVVVGLSTLAVFALGLDTQGVAIVGDVPAGFPAPSIPSMDLDQLRDLMPIALVIALVGFMESISVAKAFARRQRYEVDANQELVALGTANIAGSFFGAYPVTGGFSRTAVNAQAGARSGMASLITAGVIALALLFLTPLFYFLPNAVLAAIIMTAVFGLVDVREVKHLWAVKRADLALLGVTFFATLSLGIEEGILVGVATSLIKHIVVTTRPHYAVLGRLPGTTVWRNLANHPNAQPEPGILALRFDAQLYFGNAAFFKDTLHKETERLDVPLRAIVLDASAISQLDASGASVLLDVIEVHQERGIPVVFAGVKEPVRCVMRRAHICERAGQDAFFWTVEEAVQAMVEGGPQLERVPVPCEALPDPPPEPSGGSRADTTLGRVISQPV